MNIPAPRETICADWSIAKAEQTATTERFEARQAGGGELIKDSSIRTEGLEWSVDEHTLLIHSIAHKRESAHWEAAPSALGLPSCWQGMETLELSMSPESDNLEVRLEVVGARNLLSSDWAPASLTLCLPLRELPLTAGHRPPFEPSAIRIHVRLCGNQPNASLRCTSLLLRRAANPTLLPVLDRFGQRIHADWPGKVRSEADLHAHLEAELRDFSKLDRSDVGRFGGWKIQSPLTATGFFRVENCNGRCFFSDPEGLPFWSLGVTGIRLSDYTPFLGREWLFEELPATDGPESSAYMRRPLINEGPPDCVSFHRLNALRKYGSVEAWRKHLYERLPAWGFNTAGNWSGELLDQKSIPYTRWLRTNGSGAPLIAPHFPDVFDPAWEVWFDDCCAKEAAPHREDPWILGWFVDNELPWGRMKFAPVGENPEAFYAHYAETYFAKVARILKKHAPNHLYLGCRFVRNPPAESIVQAAGRHCDVVTVNCYTLIPPPEEFRHWFQTCGKPILIGEHHLPLASARQLPPLYQAFTTSEREAFYLEYLRSWATTPFSLGAHWFQWGDQVGTGRADGENQTVGFVDITDQPHSDLLKALKAARINLASWLGLSKL